MKNRIIFIKIALILVITIISFSFVNAFCCQSGDKFFTSALCMGSSKADADPQALAYLDSRDRQGCISVSEAILREEEGAWGCCQLTDSYCSVAETEEACKALNGNWISNQKCGTSGGCVDDRYGYDENTCLVSVYIPNLAYWDDALSLGISPVAGWWYNFKDTQPPFKIYDNYLNLATKLTEEGYPGAAFLVASYGSIVSAIGYKYSLDPTKVVKGLYWCPYKFECVPYFDKEMTKPNPCCQAKWLKEIGYIYTVEPVNEEKTCGKNNQVGVCYQGDCLVPDDSKISCELLSETVWDENGNTNLNGRCCGDDIIVDNITIFSFCDFTNLGCHYFEDECEEAGGFKIEENGVCDSSWFGFVTPTKCECIKEITEDELDDPDMGEIACEQCAARDYPQTPGTPHGAREWDEEGLCCGDDMFDDCMLRTSDNKLCVNFGGTYDDTSTPENPPEGGDDPCAGFNCGKCRYSDDPCCESTYCVEFNDDENDEITLPAGKPPYSTSGATWIWIEQLPKTKGRVIDVTCAGYSILFDGTDYIACQRNDYLVDKYGDEKSFEFMFEGDNYGGEIENPSYMTGTVDGVEIGPHEYFCHNDTEDFQGKFEIIECCGGNESNPDGICITDIGGEDENAAGYRAAVGHSLEYMDETYYCAYDADWSIDLDVKDKFTCTRGGEDWTSANPNASSDPHVGLCCSEADDEAEYYNDLNGTGICWNSTYIDNEEEFVTYSEHKYDELYILNGTIQGCAIDEDNLDNLADQTASLENMPYDIGAGAYTEFKIPGYKTYDTKLQEQINKPYNGSLGNKSNDILLDLDDHPNTGQTDYVKKDVNDNGKLIKDNKYCTLIGPPDEPNQYFCSYKEVWNLTNGINRTWLSYIEWDNDNVTQGECCPVEHCWNGTLCLESFHNDSKLLPYYDYPSENGYRCRHGYWYYSFNKTTWDYEDWGYCEDNSQCLLNPGGNPAHNGNVSAYNYGNNGEELEWQTSDENPQCINSSQFVFDHYCENGTWSSRTKQIAIELLGYADKYSKDDFTLFCDSYSNTLNYFNYTTASGVYPKKYFQEYCSVYGYDDVKCTNEVCVLLYPDENADGGYKVILGISLNQGIDETYDDDDYYPTGFSFLEALNLEIDYCNDAIENKNPFEFEKCNGDRKIWYNQDTWSVIYSRDGIDLEGYSWLQIFVEFIKDPFDAIFEYIVDNWRPRYPATGGFMPTENLKKIRDFGKLYINVKGGYDGKTIYGVTEEVLPPTEGRGKYLSVRYNNFDSDICESILRYNLLYKQNQYEISCNSTETKSTYVYSENDFGQQLWLDLTAKLRVR